MNIALVGYGRMGEELEKLAPQSNHNITAIFDIDNPLKPDSDIAGADVMIDFTLKDAVMNNLKIAAQMGVPIVEGTTGWTDQFEQVYDIENLTMIFSPNYSIGVYQFTKLVETAAKLYGMFEDYDCYLHEWHHTGKADSPSGTANKLAHILLENLPQKDKILTETSHSQIDPSALHVTSTRVGKVPGTHQVGFESPYDSIQLTHQIRGRECLAFGALKAAEWIVGKKGIFTMDDFMSSQNNKK